MSDIIRLNKDSIKNIEIIRYIFNCWVDPKLFDLSKFGDSYIVAAALNQFVKDLDPDFRFHEKEI